MEKVPAPLKNFYEGKRKGKSKPLQDSLLCNDTSSTASGPPSPAGEGFICVKLVCCWLPPGGSWLRSRLRESAKTRGSAKFILQSKFNLDQIRRGRRLRRPAVKRKETDFAMLLIFARSFSRPSATASSRRKPWGLKISQTYASLREGGGPLAVEGACANRVLAKFVL